MDCRSIRGFRSCRVKHMTQLFERPSNLFIFERDLVLLRWASGAALGKPTRSAAHARLVYAHYIFQLGLWRIWFEYRSELIRCWSVAWMKTLVICVMQNECLFSFISGGTLWCFLYTLYEKTIEKNVSMPKFVPFRAQLLISNYLNY